MKVIRWNTETEGICSEIALREKMESRGYEVTRYVYSPGVIFPNHSHQVDKLDAVVSGRFRIRMGGAEEILEAGDMLEVPYGMIHSAEVIGDMSVVSLDGIKNVSRM